MKVAWFLVGALLLVVGLGCLVVVLADVFSQPPSSLALDWQQWGMVACHAVVTGLGTFCIGRAVGKREVVAA